MLVTGGAGFIGHNLVKALISDQHQVNILDITTSEDSRVKALTQMGASYYQGDIRDSSAITRAGQDLSLIHI